MDGMGGEPGTGLHAETGLHHLGGSLPVHGSGPGRPANTDGGFQGDHAAGEGEPVAAREKIMKSVMTPPAIFLQSRG